MTRKTLSFVVRGSWFVVRRTTNEPLDERTTNDERLHEDH